MKTPIWNRILSASVLVALSSCGAQSFDVVQAQQDSGTPGATSIAPKVDILLAVDNTLSTARLQAEIQSSIRGFMAELNAQGWDFRVAVIPLASTNPTITAITASKYDSNYGSQSVQAYPGADQEGVPSHLFVPFDRFSTSVVPSTLPGGSEPGLQAIASVLTQPSTQANFVRKDAILATVVFSNGEDTSGSTRGCQVYDVNCTPPTAVSTLVGQIRNSKGAALSGSVRLFAVVNNSGGNINGCRLADGGMSYAGRRYVEASAMLGGSSHNICGTQALSQTLASIKQNLSSIKLNFTKRYIRLDKQPNESTIKVTKKSGGQSIVIPKSDGYSAGWVYLGYQENVPMIVEPFVGDFRDGYMIQLIGEQYKLMGSDSATVEFLPYGVQPSS